MKTAIILHGMPDDKESYFSDQSSPSNSHWLPWLQQELIKKGILAQTPEMPEPYEPDYEKWREVFEYFPADKDTTLVGHSCGAGFLLRWLSENKNVRVGKVVLVAPWLGPAGNVPKMFDGMKIDPALAERTAGLAMFISADDGQEELDSAKTLKQVFPNILTMEFKNRGHFVLDSMGTVEFPELRDLLLS